MQGGVVREAYQLNMPLSSVTTHATAAAAVPGLCEVDAAAVVVEAVKAAEDGSGDVIVRLYESSGGAIETAVRFGSGVLEAASLVNMMEEPLRDGQEDVAEVELASGVVRLSFGPYEIKTLRLQVSGGAGRPRL